MESVDAICILKIYQHIEELKKLSIGGVYYVLKAEHIMEEYDRNKIFILSKITDVDNCFEKSVQTAANGESVETDDSFRFEVLSNDMFTIMVTYYSEFRCSGYYDVMKKKVAKKYNRVKSSDFEYVKILGKGGFGLVVHCIKKSTGVHYAMKLQDKSQLYYHYEYEPWRVCAEKNAFACCKHPYIVELNYAFQTSRLCMKMDPDRVLLYTAELVSVLLYLHSRGLIYRDLKPGNILLQGDGHIQLVDFGTVSDMNGRTYAYQSSAVDSPFVADKFMNRGLGEMALSDSNTNSNFNSEAFPVWEELQSSGRMPIQVQVPVEEGEEDSMSVYSTVSRARSVVGTGTYMAPEMLRLCLDDSSSYSFPVDWWSLGATMYRLLTGKHAIPRALVDMFIRSNTDALYQQCLKQCKNIDFSVLEAVDKGKVGASSESESALSLISCFLEVDVTKRLGFDSVSRIVSHPYFATINWAAVENKEMVPTYIPSVVSRYGYGVRSPAPDSLKKLLVSAGKTDWLENSPIDENADEIEEHFNKWNFIGMDALLLEFESQK